MKSPEKVLIVVPTYNEAQNIRPLIDSIAHHAAGADVLIVDDNSPDGTAALVESLQKTRPNLHLLKRTCKEGLGVAYLNGFEWGLENHYDTLFQMDADLSHAASDLPRFLCALNSTDVVVGSRYVRGGKIEGWTLFQQCISRSANRYAKTLLKLPYNDLTSGFGGWHRRVLEKIDYRKIKSRGYAFQVELKNRAHRAGFQITEIPITFRNRLFGESKLTFPMAFEAGYRILQLI